MTESNIEEEDTEGEGEDSNWVVDHLAPVTEVGVTQAGLLRDRLDRDILAFICPECGGEAALVPWTISVSI